MLLKTSSFYKCSYKNYLLQRTTKKEPIFKVNISEGALEWV